MFNARTHKKRYVKRMFSFDTGISTLTATLTKMNIAKPSCVGLKINTIYTLEHKNDVLQVLPFLWQVIWVITCRLSYPQMQAFQTEILLRATWSHMC